MFIAIQHKIHDPKKFQKCAEAVFPLPKQFHVHQFLPSTDMKDAICLYEAPSIDQLSAYLEEKLKDASTQRYFPVMTAQAIGLPENIAEKASSAV